jgi:hypothetical protein
MTIDGYTKTVLTVIAVILTVIALNSWTTPQSLLRAVRLQSAEAQIPKEASVPKAWGKVVGFNPGLVFFESSDGTLRAVSLYDEKDGGCEGCRIGSVYIALKRN